MTPERIQMRRTKGWRKPEAAIYVGRPSLWGNPWSLSDGPTWNVPVADRPAWVVARYRRELETFSLLSDWSTHVSEPRWQEVNNVIRSRGWTSMAEAAPFFLGGHDLACWCPLDQPCHADVLLELANR